MRLDETGRHAQDGMGDDGEDSADDDLGHEEPETLSQIIAGLASCHMQVKNVQT